jgi:hypothetical protein
MTAQQCLDIGYLVKNYPGSSYQANADSYFCLSVDLLHPAYREVLVKIGYGSPALLKSIGDKYDQQLSRVNDFAKQGLLLIKLFTALQEEMQGKMNPFAKELNIDPSNEDELNKLYNQKGAGRSWFNCRVKRDSARGMLFFIRKVHNVIAAGGKVTVEDKPMSVHDYVNPDKESTDIMFRTKYATYSPDLTEKEIEYYINLRIKDAKENLEEYPDQESKIDKKALEKCAKFLKQKKQFRSPDKKKAQFMLKEAGFYKDKLDGDFGKGSKAALSLYMKKNGLTDGKKAMKHLLENYDKKFPPLKTNVSDEQQNNNDENNQNKNSNDDKQPDIPSGSSLFGNIAEVIQSAIKQISALISLSDPVKVTIKAIQQAIKADGHISASVGIGGKNKKPDVIAIKFMLYKRGFYDISITELVAGFTLLDDVDSRLEEGIKKFQASNNVRKPDGRVDVDGNTLKWLTEGRQSSDDNNENNSVNDKNVSDEVQIKPTALDASVFPCFN